LLDTGVWTAHQLFQSRIASPLPPGPGLVAFDCVTSSHCTGNDPGDTDIGQTGHGTTVCGLLIGDATMGDCLEGVTSALVECRRVYKPDPNAPSSLPKGMLDPRAYKRACQKLLLDRNAIAVLEVAEDQAPGGPLGRTAASLYKAGLAVVAAAG